MPTEGLEGTFYVPALKPQAHTQPQSQSIDDVKPWISGKHIVVAGAGMSGLAFAIALSQQFPPKHPPPTLTIYERDSHENRIGREGYTLSLRTDDRSGGIQILDQLGLYESCRDVSVSHVSRMSIWKNDFSNALLRVSVGPVGPKGLMAVRIRRNALQKVLADKVQECGWDIRWETAVVSAEKIQEGEREAILVTLSSGKTIPCDLLVAADGARSKILSTLRPNATLSYSGVTMMLGTGRFNSPESIPKPLDTDYGLVLGGSGTGLFVSPVDETSALWSFSYYHPQPCESVRYPMSAEQEETLMNEARLLAKNFDPAVLTLVNATDPTSLMCFPAMHRTPVSNLESPAVQSPVRFEQSHHPDPTLTDPKIPPYPLTLSNKSLVPPHLPLHHRTLHRRRKSRSVPLRRQRREHGDHRRLGSRHLPDYGSPLRFPRNSSGRVRCQINSAREGNATDVTLEYRCGARYGVEVVGVHAARGGVEMVLEEECLIKSSVRSRWLTV